jgi:hypothetical protein
MRSGRPRRSSPSGLRLVSGPALRRALGEHCRDGDWDPLSRNRRAVGLQADPAAVLHDLHRHSHDADRNVPVRVMCLGAEGDKQHSGARRPITRHAGLTSDGYRALPARPRTTSQVDRARLCLGRSTSAERRQVRNGALAMRESR